MNLVTKVFTGMIALLLAMAFGFYLSGKYNSKLFSQYKVNSAFVYLGVALEYSNSLSSFDLSAKEDGSAEFVEWIALRSLYFIYAEAPEYDDVVISGARESLCVIIKNREKVDSFLKSEAAKKYWLEMKARVLSDPLNSMFTVCRLE